jgi:hypothetical protein
MFFQRHVKYGELSINEMRIGGAYSDLYQDSMQIMRDSVLYFRALSESKRLMPTLSRYDYIARLTSKEIAETDTITTVFSMDGRAIYCTMRRASY